MVKIVREDQLLRDILGPNGDSTKIIFKEKRTKQQYLRYLVWFVLAFFASVVYLASETSLLLTFLLLGVEKNS